MAKARFYSNGVEEWYLLRTLQMCAVTLRLFRFVRGGTGGNASGGARYGAGPRRLDSPVALLFGGEAVMNRELDSGEAHLLGELHARGISLVVAGLCGFGEDLWRGGLWEFAPLLVGRTHVGLHAEEVLHVVSWVDRVLGAERVVLIAAEDAAPAVLHAALHVPRAMRTGAVLNSPRGSGSARSRSSGGKLAGIAVLRGICCFEDVAGAWRHHMPWQMQMYGVLKHYDLPDLLAALAISGGLDALVIEPRDERRQPLPWRRAWDKYDLAARRFALARRRLRILAGQRSASEAYEVAAFVAAALGVRM